MTEQELYAKAKQLGEQITTQLDNVGGTYQEGMTVFGYAVALIIHAVAMEKGKDVQREAAYFGRYIQTACATFEETGEVQA